MLEIHCLRAAEHKYTAAFLTKIAGGGTGQCFSPPVLLKLGHCKEVMQDACTRQKGVRSILLCGKEAWKGWKKFCVSKTTYTFSRMHWTKLISSVWSMTQGCELRVQASSSFLYYRPHEFCIVSARGLESPC